MTKNNILTLIFISILASCSYDNAENDSKKDKTINDIENKTNLKDIQVPTNLIDYFEDFKSNIIKVEVDSNIVNELFKVNDCLPLNFMLLFEDFIPQTQTESTGAKPLGKIKMNEGNYFMVVVQQDDYGPIYYGFTYNKNKNIIQSCEKIAETWGDAGDSQIMYSTLIVEKNKVEIKKFIETCHVDLEEQNNEMVVNDINCTDSIATLQLRIKN